MPERSVTRTVVVPASPEETWDALVEPDRLEEWFADEVEGDFAPDEPVRFAWDDGERRDAIVEEVEAPHRLTFRWRDAEGDESRVAFALDEIDDGATRVVVVESGLTLRAAARRAGVRAASGPRLVAAVALIAA